MARTDAAPATKYLKDYRAPAFKLDDLHLLFQLNTGVTTVTATTRYTRADATTTDLVLEGDASLDLVSLKRDGTDLIEGRDYVRDGDGIILKNCPASFTLETVTKIKPEENTRLEGLYSSSNTYCTQCEAEGFRNITYFPDRPDVLTRYTVRIEADKKSCPVLLSNGNLTEEGDLPNGRHYTVWKDPFPKPCYLFALVAGDLALVRDSFTIKSGRKVDLRIYVNHGNEDKCAHAMESLKNSMKWDEDVYGLEYDLDIFNIVAVNDFNSGAMENKSLNIFNAKLVLAKPDTATDLDYLNIEGVVAHEYLHNWSGNRVTCRDWFQLSLKEGLTVFRDRQFSSDMNSAAVKRIEDVQDLRNRQFLEDAGPMAHPIRPDNYIKIDNFYTVTIYEKGAEVIGMLHSLLGPKAYRAATDLYFKRHDGQAVTCEDFVKCMEDSSGVDLAQFRRWYSQAGTPELDVRHRYDAASKKLTLTIKQQTAPTPGQPVKEPLHMPIAVGLLSRRDGREIRPTQILELRDREQTFVFDNIDEPVIPSLLRGFSAPVKMTSDLSDDDLLFLLAHDTDGFARWDAGQTALQRLILGNAASGQRNNLTAGAKAAFASLLADHKGDHALMAMALTLPDDAYLAQLMMEVNVDGLTAARNGLMASLGAAFKNEWKDLYAAMTPPAGTSYAPTPAQMGQRALRGAALSYIQSADPALATALAADQYKTATNMTDRVQALATLADLGGAETKTAFDDFYAKTRHDPQMLDKWFALQAGADRADTVEKVMELMKHPDFTLKTPNRLRALVGTFNANFAHFHRADGAGYRLLAETVIATDKINPQTAARLLGPLRQWRQYDAARRGMMETELKRILAETTLSPNVYEIVSKCLGAPARAPTPPKP